MSEDYVVQQGSPALPWMLGGAAVGAAGGLGLNKFDGVHNWTHNKAAYASPADIVKETNEKDKFVSTVKGANVCEESEIESLRATIEEVANDQKELHQKKSAIVGEYFKDGAPKSNAELDAARNEYLEAVEKEFNATKAVERATADTKEAAVKTLEDAKEALTKAKEKVDAEVGKITEKITGDAVKTGDALKTEVEKIIGTEAEATKKALENSSKKDVIAKLLKSPKNWKYALVTAGSAVVLAIVGALIRPKAKNDVA